ncbi:hypothetical protein QR680_004238 [Steinernema hermaphroditum]|uniref:Serpin domain-containing protein n=1 Tax=Steinernema hermaphroditum TaxID=289476 RepID=A0AA39LTD9_9BILA|nr:hypothetical protein QR680_004238 [Steinernema hermaphroditum]
MERILAVAFMASLFWIASISATSGRATGDALGSATFNETEGAIPAAVIVGVQTAAALIKTSGTFAKYPSADKFLDYATTVVSIPAFAETPEIEQEVAKLRMSMAQMQVTIKSTASQITALLQEKDIKEVNDDEFTLSHTIAVFLRKDPGNKSNERVIDTCKNHPPLGMAMKLHASMINTSYVNVIFESSDYSLAVYTNLQAWVHKIGFNLAKWWNIGPIREVQKVLSSYEFENISKASAAQKLKNHLDQTFGRSHWPEKDVHRFGVLIFNDSFYHPTVKTDDQNAFLFPWKKEKSIVLVYKSTFGSDRNETYLSNQKFFEQNIATINNTLGSVLRGGCYFGPHFDAIVPRDLKWVTTNLKKSHEGLFYFWLTTDEKVTVPRDSWLKFLFKTKEVDREWTEADIGWAVGTSEESRAAAVIQTVIPGITCFLMEKGVFPLLIMVGF